RGRHGAVLFLKQVFWHPFYLTPWHSVESLENPSNRRPKTDRAILQKDFHPVQIWSYGRGIPQRREIDGWLPTRLSSECMPTERNDRSTIDVFYSAVFYRHYVVGLYPEN